MAGTAVKHAVIALALLGCTRGEALPRAGEVIVAGAEVRIAPSTATSAAGYAELRHLGTTADTLLEVRADAGRASLHQSVTAEGLVQMRPVSVLEIPAGRTTRLAPGGLHLMLDAFTRPLVVGDTVRFTLRFARGGAVTVPAPVRPVGNDD